MKFKIIFVIVIILCCNDLFSQISRYEKGYFIDNNNKKTECLIKNLEWDFNPKEFEYKTDENSSSNTMKLDDFQEFSVGEEYTFKKVTVKIDKSSDAIADASTIKATNFVDDVLLLRVIVEGKATLYSYKTDNYLRFFYSKDENLIHPLSYKVYYDQQAGDYRTNRTYRQELLNDLKCESITQNEIERLEYIETSMTKLFIKYNVCSGDVTKKTSGAKKHNTLELYAKAGIGISDFYINYDGHTADFSKKTSLEVAVESEINFSEKFKRWSALVEVGYQQYSNSYYFDYVNDYTAELNYKSVDLSIGLRRYFGIASKSNLYLSGYLTYKFAMNSTLNYSNATQDLDVVNRISQAALGLGYAYDKKYILELRYEVVNNLFKSSSARSKFSTVGIMLAYKFL
ncbi:hypothetical protein [Flavobacterium terrisoli]|uniref:hypothetical protein n=1 Tax=Flavobacterium terrisoli TaxID=3242195 RepID=UPI002543FAFE|nr:hypothetical protein [Flavobacterium buctense]